MTRRYDNLVPHGPASNGGEAVQGGRPPWVEQSLERTAGKYARTGEGYEDRTYGRDHLQMYRDLRNEQIATILRDCFPPEQSLRILEVGCGTGIVLEYLGTLRLQHVLFGVDASDVMLEQARQRATDKNLSVELVQASCNALPYAAGSMDVVLATRFIHLFSHEEKLRVYAEFRRVLRTGGLIIVEFYSRPFAWLRYYVGGVWRHKTKSEFFSHYPTRRQLTEIVSVAFEKRPLRLAGSRLLLPLLGEARLRALTRRAVRQAGLNLLVDEYFVVTRK